MRLNKQLVRDLKLIFVELFDRNLSDEEAQSIGISVVRLVSAKELQNNQFNKGAITNESK
jgi:hypothetical protein